MFKGESITTFMKIQGLKSGLKTKINRQNIDFSLHISISGYVWVRLINREISFQLAIRVNNLDCKKITSIIVHGQISLYYRYNIQSYTENKWRRAGTICASMTSTFIYSAIK